MSGLLDSFPDKCSIRLRNRVKNATTKITHDTLTTLFSNVTCWIQPLSQSVIMDYQKRGINVDHEVFFLSDYGLTEQHELLATERSGVASSMQMDVKTVASPDASAGLGVVYKVVGNQKSGSLQ